MNMSSNQNNNDPFDNKPFDWGPIKKFARDALGYISYGLVAFFAVLMIYGAMRWYWNSAEIRAENAVRTAVNSCIGRMTQGVNAIMETNQLNQQQREFLYTLYLDVFAGKEGSVERFAAFVSTMNGTDLNATTLQVMQVIEAQRMVFANCQADIQTTQGTLHNLIDGPLGQNFAASMDRPRELPFTATARPTVDLDGDGRITVLDYPVIAAADILNAQSGGVDPGPLDLSSPTKTTP